MTNKKRTNPCNSIDCKQESILHKRKRAIRIYDGLLKQYPDVRCTLDNNTPQQFLLSAIMSPQTTDINTNAVSKVLWERYPTLDALSNAPLGDLENAIRSIGLYKVKSRAIQLAAQRLLVDYGGSVPDTLEELMKFKGVGRKVALVVLQEVHHKVEGIIIDTHNIRIAHRFCLSISNDAARIEKDCMEILPKDRWALWSHLMVAHGRALCTARSPRCFECPVIDDCYYPCKNIKIRNE